MIYVLNKDGKTLMPSTRWRHIKTLLREGKAVKISSYPFVVKLLYETEDKTQPIILGIAPGRTDIGMSAVRNDGMPLFEAEVETRNKKIPKLMQTRKMHRMATRHHRREKRQRRAIASGLSAHAEYYRMLPQCNEPIRCKVIRNKEARFCNRKRPAGWLTPTANHLLQTHVNMIRKIMRYVPVTDITVQLDKFAFMALENPNIKPWEYQKGPLHNMGSVENAVYVQQNGHCLLCERAIEEYHHVVPRSKNGSETLANRVGLCRQHHDMVHKDAKCALKVTTLKAGLNKKYHSLSVLNQIIPFLAKQCADMLPTKAVESKDVYAFRMDNGIEKSRANDAYAVACVTLDRPNVQVIHDSVFQVMQFRRHDRMACRQEMLDRKYLLDGKIVAVNRHKAETQATTNSLEEYVANGGRTDNLTVKPHRKIYQRMNRIMPGATFLVDGKRKVMYASSGLHKGVPDYYKFTDGTKATPKKCKLLAQNKGLVFVSNMVA